MKNEEQDRIRDDGSYDFFEDGPCRPETFDYLDTPVHVDRPSENFAPGRGPSLAHWIFTIFWVLILIAIVALVVHS